MRAHAVRGVDACPLQVSVDDRLRIPVFEALAEDSAKNRLLR